MEEKGETGKGKEVEKEEETEKGNHINRAPHGYGSIQVTRQVDPKYSGQVIKFITQYQVRLQV